LHFPFNCIAFREIVLLLLLWPEGPGKFTYRIASMGITTRFCSCGQGDRAEGRAYLKRLMRMGISVGVFVAAVVLVFKSQLPFLFTSDPAVGQLVTQLLPIAGLLMVRPDTASGVRVTATTLGAHSQLKYRRHKPQTGGMTFSVMQCTCVRRGICQTCSSGGVLWLLLGHDRVCWT
jgi:hypothetical protein